VVHTAKVKTSVYADKELWEKFKLKVARRGIEVSQALEELIRDELFEEMFDEVLKGISEVEGYEIDFEPIKPKAGFVSVFVRSLRDERANSLS
jgi:hypothetical protein